MLAACGGLKNALGIAYPDMELAPNWVPGWAFIP